MRAACTLTLAAGLLMLVGCGDPGPATEPSSGVSGVVTLGPQCPVESAADPCEDRPAAQVTVIVSELGPGGTSELGEEVARSTTGADGTFTVALEPGEYVVVAEAGMSCEPTAARVVPDAYTTLDIACDTGIR